MAPVVAAASLMLGAYSVVQQKKAAKKQEQAGRAAAAAELASTEEEKRKLAKENAYRESLAKAKAGASGVGAGGTVAQYLSELKSSGQKNLDWLTLVGASRANAALAGADIAATQSTAGAWGTLGSTLGSAYATYNMGG